MAKLLRNPFEKNPGKLSSGLRFERYVMSYLSEHLSNQYMVIPSVIMDNSSDAFDTSGSVTRREIDHLIIGPNGLFLLESKNYHGLVDGFLWGYWDITKSDQNGIPLPYRQRSERKEAVVLQERMFRVSAIVQKYINKTKQISLNPYRKVRGIFVFPEDANLNFLAKDGTRINPQADVRAVPLDKLVTSIESDPLPKYAQPIPKKEILKLSEIVDRGLNPTYTSSRVAEKIIGQYKLEEEIYKDQAPNGLNFTVYKVRDLNTGIEHRGKYYDWTPMDKQAQAVWTEQIKRHKTALSALSANKHIHQIITALEDGEGYGYLVIESWMNNPTLNKLINNPQELKNLDLNQFMLNLALGVRAVHKRKFVHRELSPKSVFVEVDENDAIITNFELAKMLGDKVVTSSQEIPTVFTRRVPLNAYRAPEIAVKPHDVDASADIYSWGSIYFRLITGHQFKNESKAFDLLAAADVKDEIRTLVEKCLEADPSERLRDIEEVVVTMRGSLP